jgi:putative sterol carrier protein
VVRNEQNPMGAFMTGKIRVDGDMGLALRLRDLLS